MSKNKQAETATEIEVDDAMVVAAATDINDTFKPDPLLDLEKPGEELQKEVEELFPDIVKGDKLTEETWKTLIALGWKAAKTPTIEKPISTTSVNSTPTVPVKASGVPHKASKPAKAAPVPPKPVKPAKAAKKASKTVGRMGAVGLVLAKGKIKKSAIAEQADKLYVKSGGKSNIKTATMFYYFARQLLKAMGKWQEEDGVVYQV